MPSWVKFVVLNGYGEVVFKSCCFETARSIANRMNASRDTTLYEVAGWPVIDYQI